MNKEDTLQLDILIQSFLRAKGYETHDYICLVSEKGSDETAVVTCMDPRTAVDELSSAATALRSNIRKLTQ